MLRKIPSDYFDKGTGTLKLLWEEEWRAFGITQVGPVASFLPPVLDMLMVLMLMVVLESWMGKL